MMRLTSLTIGSFLIFDLAEQAVASCSKNTGGTCQAQPCAAERNASCIDKKCMCTDGFCSDENGQCKYQAECSAHTSCGALQGSCCPPDENSSNLDCCATEEVSQTPFVNETQCGKDTGANCHVLNCKKGRNATCLDRQCVCPDGFCTVPDPTTDKDMLCGYFAQCAMHSKCASKNLLGDCCPGPTGMLDCCSSTDSSVAGYSAGLGDGLSLPLLSGIIAVVLLVQQVS